MRKIRELLRRQKGQAVLEMALVLPVFLLLVMGMMEFGRAFNGAMVMTAAAREGARSAAVGNTDAVIASTVQAAAVGFTPGQLTITINPAGTGRKRGDPVTVTVATPIQMVTPLIAAFFPDGIYQARGRAVMRME